MHVHCRTEPPQVLTLFSIFVREQAAANDQQVRLIGQGFVASALIPIHGSFTSSRVLSHVYAQWPMTPLERRQRVLMFDVSRIKGDIMTTPVHIR